MEIAFLILLTGQSSGFIYLLASDFLAADSTSFCAFSRLDDKIAYVNKHHIIQDTHIDLGCVPSLYTFKKCYFDSKHFGGYRFMGLNDLYKFYSKLHKVKYPDNGREASIKTTLGYHLNQGLPLNIRYQLY